MKAKPYDFDMEPKQTALVVIDMQRDFIEPGGFGSSLGNDVSLLQRIIPTTRKLIDAARKAGIPIIHTREAHKPDMSDCPPAKRRRGNSGTRIGDKGPMGRVLIDGEPGNEIISVLAPITGEYEIAKPGKGAFYNTGIQDILDRHGIQKIIFAGVTTEVCVQTSMREANDRGYDCVLVEDATESYFPEFKRATIDMIIAQGGIVGWVTTCDEVIKSLAE